MSKNKKVERDVEALVIEQENKIADLEYEIDLLEGTIESLKKERNDAIKAHEALRNSLL